MLKKTTMVMKLDFYAEYKLNSGDSLINYSEMLKQEKGREFFFTTDI